MCILKQSSMILHMSLIGFLVTKKRVILPLNKKMIEKVIRRNHHLFLEKEVENIHQVKTGNLLIKKLSIKTEPNKTKMVQNRENVKNIENIFSIKPLNKYKEYESITNNLFSEMLYLFIINIRINLFQVQTYFSEKYVNCNIINQSTLTTF